MKKIYILAAVLCLAACTKPEAAIEYHPTQPSDGTMTIKATLPANLTEAATKVSLNAMGNGWLKPAWESADKICVNGKEFTIQDASAGIFKGEALDAKSYEIVYPASAKTADGAKALVPATQKQVGNNSFSHLCYYAALKGVDTCDDVTFTKEWAVAHGGDLVSTSVLKFIVFFPEEVTAVQQVSLDCGEAVHTLALENATLGNDHKLVAYLQVPDEDIEFSSGKKLRFTALDQDAAEIVKDFTCETQTLYRGRVNEFTVGGDWPTGVKKGKGSESDPYIITNVDEFQAIRDLLEVDVITCFRLDADLDMSGVTGWKPFNDQNAALGINFNGNGHTIKNFTASGNTKWLSMFGVLHGAVKNLTLENPVLTNSYAAPSGILCAWAGNSDGKLSATVENVHIKGGKATMTNATNYFGGMIGNVVNSTVKNCSFEGSVERTGGTENTYCPVGGLIGWTDFDASVEDCSTSGTLKCKNGRSCGGVIGYAHSVIDVKNCSSSMEITTGGDCAGGICGWTNGGTFTGCKSTCTINCGVTQSGASTSYSGGIAAHISTSATFEDCSFVGTIIAKGNLVGGITGQVNAGTGQFRRCSVDATLKGLSVMGGIVGRTKDKENVVIENCCSRGTITGTTYIAGIVGDFFKDNVMRNCYSTMAVTGTYGLGGLISRCSNASAASVLMGGQGFNTTVSGCIAWNPSVKATTAGGEDPAGHYSGGCIIGYTAPLNILTDNYRNPNMEFAFYAEGPGTTSNGKSYTYNGYNEPYDQANTNATTALYRKFTDATKDKYYFPYFGKAASSSDTVSSLAKSLGWDQQVWDLSGEFPVLK